MDANEFIQTVDHASAQDDRWLFVAAFCLLLLLCGIVIFWLVRQLQNLLTDHKQLRAEHHESLSQIISMQNDTALKLAVCIDRNTAALQECGFELRRFQEQR